MKEKEENASPCATIVLVGHCGADEWLLRNAVSRALPGARIESVSDEADLKQHLQPDRLLLVNRVLGPEFGAASGVELIRSIDATSDPPRMMLVSNHSDAQADALQAGALPGFGKRNVYDESTVQRLRDACGLREEEHRSPTGRSG